MRAAELRRESMHGLPALGPEAACACFCWINPTACPCSDSCAPDSATRCLVCSASYGADKITGECVKCRMDHCQRWVVARAARLSQRWPVESMLTWQSVLVWDECSAGQPLVGRVQCSAGQPSTAQPPTAAPPLKTTSAKRATGNADRELLSSALLLRPGLPP